MPKDSELVICGKSSEPELASHSNSATFNMSFMVSYLICKSVSSSVAGKSWKQWVHRNKTATCRNLTTSNMWKALSRMTRAWVNTYFNFLFLRLPHLCLSQLNTRRTPIITEFTIWMSQQYNLINFVNIFLWNFLKWLNLNL